MGIIYCFRNKINNKKYIGQTQNANHRLRMHKHRYLKQLKEKETSPNLKFKDIPKLYSAFYKYGLDAFEFYIIENNINNDKIDELEIYYISLCDSINNGYNLALGGKTCLGVKRDEEFKAKMSEITRGDKNGNYGNRWTEEQRKNASIQLKKRNTKGKELKNRQVYEYIFKSPDGIEYKTRSLTVFCNEHGLKIDSLSDVATGRHKSCFGWTMVNKERIKKFNQ